MNNNRYVCIIKINTEYLKMMKNYANLLKLFFLKCEI